MSQKKISPISLFSIHLEMIRGGKKIGSGTGFMYFHKASGSHFLVTNYHVLTARAPTKPSLLLSGYPDSPDEIRWSSLNKNCDDIISGSIDLLSNDGVEWLEHAEREQGVDIVAVKVDFPEDVLVLSQDKLDLVDDIELEIGSDLFIVGYPYGISAGDFFPLWKKGTIASEPLINPNGLARFYIDATTTPGMSGSPVFVSEDRDVIVLNRDEAIAFEAFESGTRSALDVLNSISTKSMKPYKKKCFKLVGIYSGRLVNGNKDPGIGIVWKTHLIEELFSNPIITKHPYPPHRLDA